MIKQDYILLIMNCEKYKKKALHQKQTWLKNLPAYLKYYHVIGNENLDVMFRFDDEQNILYLKVADDYISLPKKVIAAYAAVYIKFDFTYIFKTDDDQLLTNDKFFGVLKNLLESNKNLYHYGGYVIDVKQNYLSHYHRLHPELPEYLPVLQTKYCSGRFYFLSKQATCNLFLKRENIEKEYLEDYAIGYNLDSIYKTNILPLITTKMFTDMNISTDEEYIS
jgi:hypothetical protein